MLSTGYCLDFTSQDTSHWGPFIRGVARHRKRLFVEIPCGSRDWIILMSMVRLPRNRHQPSRVGRLLEPTKQTPDCIAIENPPRRA